MGRVLTNAVTLSVATESAPGTPGTVWEQLEPNTIGAAGPTVETTARDPISRDRQRVKGLVTKLEAGLEVEHDVTMSALKRFLGAFLFVRPTNADLEWRDADVTATGFTVPALDASQAGRLLFNASGPTTLLHAAGYAVAGNNGVHPLSAAANATDTEVQAAGLTVESGRPQASVGLAGVRASAGDLSLTVTGTTGTLTSGNGAGTALDFTTLGLTAGQFIHVGGVETANRLAAAVYGYARVTAVAAGQLTLDKLSAALVTEAGVGNQVDLLFGQFYRNVPVDHADYLEETFTAELTYPGLGPADETMYEYVNGLYAAELGLELAANDKATMSLTMVGLEADVPTTTRETGADAPLLPGRRGAVSTSSDVARLRVADVDESGLTTDFKSLSLNFNNNVEGEYVLGSLGPKFVNAGNFEVDVEAELVFTNADVAARVVDNTVVTMDMILRNDDGAFAVDVPALTLGNGERGFEVDQSVNLTVEAQAVADAVFGVSLTASFFPVVPE